MQMAKVENFLLFDLFMGFSFLEPPIYYLCLQWPKINLYLRVTSNTLSDILCQIYDCAKRQAEVDGQFWETDILVMILPIS